MRLVASLLPFGPVQRRRLRRMILAAGLIAGTPACAATHQDQGLAPAKSAPATLQPQNAAPPTPERRPVPSSPTPSGAAKGRAEPRGDGDFRSGKDTDRTTPAATTGFTSDSASDTVAGSHGDENGTADDSTAGPKTDGDPGQDKAADPKNKPGGNATDFTGDPPTPETGTQPATTEPSGPGKKPDSTSDTSGPKKAPVADRGPYMPHGPAIIPGPDAAIVLRGRGGDEHSIAPGFMQAFAPTGNAVLATQRGAGDTVNLVSMNVDGSNQRQLTDSGVAGPSSWARNGTIATSFIPATASTRTQGRVAERGPQLAKVEPQSQPQIYVITPDGKPTALTANEHFNTTPSWSPDGTKIAYSTDQDGDFNLYVMNADGTNPKRLTEGKGNEFSPTWSPDGKQIAYAGNEDGNFQIYVIPSEGGDAQRITQNDVDDAFPTWSSEGIAFSRQVGTHAQVFIAAARTVERRDATERKQRLTANHADDVLPAWSPDGEHIAMTRRAEQTTTPTEGRGNQASAPARGLSAGSGSPSHQGPSREEGRGVPTAPPTNRRRGMPGAP